MFVSPSVKMLLSKANLKLSKDDKNVEHKDVEVALVIEPFSRELANEIGDEIASHLFDERGAIRRELETITLDPRVPAQQVTVSATADASHVSAVLRLVQIGLLSVARIEDERSGDEWLKATVKAKFDLAPRVHRDFIAALFGEALYFSFEAEQLDLPIEKAKKG